MGTILDSGAGGGLSAATGSTSFAGCAGNVTLSWTLNAGPTLTASGPGVATIGTAIPTSGISATLTSGAGPTGTVTFTVFRTFLKCPLDLHLRRNAGRNGNGVRQRHLQPECGDTPSAAGDYWWYASYGGDANNTGATSLCGAGMSETVVALASPALSVAAPSFATAGTAIPASSITATLSGSSGSNDASPITFTVFGPSSSAPSTCASGGTQAGTATPAGNGTYVSSGGLTLSTTGDYWW